MLPDYVYDMSAGALALPTNKRTKPFKNAVKRLSDALSAQVDLVRAAQLMVAGRELGGPYDGVKEVAQDPKVAQLMGAAAQMALLSYARIVTNNDDRGRVPLEQGADDEIRAAHERVLAMRHGAIGHFGYTKNHPAGPNASDTVMLGEKDAHATFRLRFNRMNYRQSITEDLAKVLEHGTNSIQTIIASREADVMKAIESLQADEWDLVRRHQLDPATYDAGVQTTLAPPRSRDA